MCSNPFKSPQGPSHSVLPQGFRIRTKCSLPYVVFTWQRGEMSYRKGESSTDTFFLFCDCLNQDLRDIQNIDVTKHFQKNFVRGHSPSLLQWENRHVETWFPRHFFVPKDPAGRKKIHPQSGQRRNRCDSSPTSKHLLFCLDLFPQVPPHRTWQLAQLTSAPLESRCWRKVGRSRGSDAMVRTSVTPPVISTMASWGKPILRAL